MVITHIRESSFCRSIFREIPSTPGIFLTRTAAQFFKRAPKCVRSPGTGSGSQRRQSAGILRIIMTAIPATLTKKRATRKYTTSTLNFKALRVCNHNVFAQLCDCFLNKVFLLFLKSLLSKADPLILPDPRPWQQTADRARGTT